MAAGGAALAVPNARDREDRLGRSGGVLRGPIPEPRSTRELILLIATWISQNSPLEWLASFRLVFEYFKQTGSSVLRDSQIRIPMTEMCSALNPLGPYLASLPPLSPSRRVRTLYPLGFDRFCREQV